MPADTLRAAATAVLDSMDAGCTGTEIRSDAEYLRGEIDRGAVALPEVTR